MAFRGTYQHTLDAKFRLTVPSRFRKQLADGVVLAQNFEGAIGLWSADDFDAYVDQSLAGLNPASEEARDLERFFSANSFDTELDAAGRVMVPQKLREWAELGREITLIGARRCLEIWDRERWDELKAELDKSAPETTKTLGHTA